MQEQQNAREERRARIRKKKRQRLIVIAVMVLVVVLVVVLAVTVVRAVRRAQRGEITQIGPPAPTAEDMVADIPLYYDYAVAVPQSAPAPSGYFGNCLFVGDARLGGFSLYGSLSGADILSSGSASVDKVLTMSFGDTTLEAALAANRYDAVYLSLGVNELGWVYAETFATEYAKVIDAVRQQQPQASIYLHLILPVSASKNGNPSHVTNANIEAYNAMIRQLALEKGVYFLDASGALCDENGYLLSTLTTDGLNLNREGIEAWYEYLNTHYVEKEKYIN